MKKIILSLTAFFMSAAMLVTVYAESQVNSDDIEEIVAVTGIMTMDEYGSFNGSETVTRAALAKIVVTLAGDEGLVGINSRISPFSDVSYSYWAAPYIRVATEQDYMSGYMDGSFKPSDNATYEEAVTAMLMVLGYSEDDFLTGYPTAQLAQAKESGLLLGVDGQIGSALTRTQMAILVYNTLNAGTYDDEDETQAEVLGYDITTDELSLSDVLSEAAEGPVTYQSMNQFAGIDSAVATVYLDGRTSSVQDLELYDIIYYSVDSQTIWAYSEKVSGIVDSIEPDRETPTSVTIDDVDYDLESVAAQKAFGAGGLEEGDMVTLLLDRSGDVADAYLTETLYGDQVGVVIDSEVKSYEVGSGDTQTDLFATILLPDGQTLDVTVTSDPEDHIGDIAVLTYSEGSVSVRYDSSATSIEGTVDEDSSTITDSDETYSLAPSVVILEIDDYGNVAEITLSRLDGVELDEDEVLTVVYNSLGQIQEMILKDVTRDTASFGFLTSSVETSSGMSGSSSYEYDIENATSTLKYTDKSLNVSEGPAMFVFEDDSIEAISELNKISEVIVSINPLYVTDDDGNTYKLSSDVAVYKEVDDTYIYTTLSEAEAWEDDVYAYYDKAEENGGLVRVLYLK